MKNPCNGCVVPKRHIGCHAECKEHAKWKQWRDKVAANERKEKDSFVEHGRWYQTPDGYWRNDKKKGRR